MIKKKLSVRRLAEFAERSGDIDMRLVASVKPLDGTRLHKILQRSGGEDYQPEMHLKTTLVVEDVRFTVSGRADGIIVKDGTVTVDEIKTTLRNLDNLEPDSHPAHWAQAKCYAHMFAEEHGTETVNIRLTYCHAMTNEIRRFEQTCNREQLAEYFVSLLLKFVRWAHWEDDWNEISRGVMSQLPFPFETFRDSQRKFAGAVYRAARDGYDLFAAAPTGTGKTVSALYPAVRALGDGFAEKIFYMTAKETGRGSAIDAVFAMENRGLRAKTVAITAKDRICPLEQRTCYPERCPRADGHFDRSNDAAFAALRNNDYFSRELIEQLSETHCVCPFEFQLEIAEYADIVVCDYNYIFDPKVYLRRFFSESEAQYIFLADEAHNLPDRARDMYSCELPRRAIAAARKNAPANKGLRSALSKLDKYLQALKQEEPCELLLESRPDVLIALVTAVNSHAANALLDGEEFSAEMLDAYWLTLDYERVNERFDDDYAAILRSGEREVTVKLYCSAPAKELRERLIPAKTAVFFSATLAPFDYYRDTLGARDAKALALPSPFPRGNFLPVVANAVSTRYRDRAKSLETVAAMIAATVRAKRGNYIAFFPSYAYLRDVYALFADTFPDIAAHCQTAKMDSAERENFLRRFDEPSDGFVAFCVQGGVFAEGVDLRGERVVGVIIVGAGLPGIGAERELLRERFGFDYAYTFPGFNRVLQAAGRLIRTETDRGAAVLIDDRLSRQPYPALFPEHWSHRLNVRNTAALENALAEFWNV